MNALERKPTMNPKDLADFAEREAQLVWSRYNCMVIANSILLGFIGQSTVQRDTKSLLGMIACLIGLVIALLWLFTTSYGWSLSSFWFRASKGDDDGKSDIYKVYEDWLNKVWAGKSQDPLWWFAHAVIIVFCIAYLGLAFFITSSIYGCYLGYIVPCAFTGVFIIALIIWGLLTKRKLHIWDE